MGVRVDKWLWAARFFKTRAKAKEAIDGGKVDINGTRAKPSKELQVGDELSITQGWDEKVVVVDGLSDRRGSATIAQTLYSETEDSIARREMIAEQRRAAGGQVRSEGRPSKKDRRQIHQFRSRNQ
ncbi:MAG: RNA-binding S4 domain-containing protein [Pseudomonadales bacterium]|jgi:ribosome-associated heat shock protein Hsp15